MFWDRIIGGILGLLLAFSAGGELQFWLDEGKVRYRPKHGATRLLSYDETPFSYVGQIAFYILIVLVGLLLVWAALNGDWKNSPGAHRPDE
jgi:hypothetical protein